MPIIDERAIVLPHVPILQGVNLDNPLEVNVLTVHQENPDSKKIKQMRLTEIISRINELRNKIGTASEDSNIKNKSLYPALEETNASIEDIYDTIGTPKADNAEGVGSGLYGLIEDLQADRDIIKNKYLVEGYKIHFISPKNKVNLLAGDSTSKYKYTFSDVKENIATCISNHQNYSVNMHLGLTYSLKNSTLGELSTSVIVNLNAVYASKDKKAIIYIPVANANIGLKFTFSNNEISFVVSDKIGTDVIKSDELIVQHGVLEFNKLNTIVPDSSS